MSSQASGQHIDLTVIYSSDAGSAEDAHESSEVPPIDSETSEVESSDFERSQADCQGSETASIGAESVFPEDPEVEADDVASSDGESYDPDASADALAAVAVADIPWTTVLSDALSAIRLKGDPAAHRVYSKYVHPGLRVAGFCIGLPLSDVGAMYIKRASQHITAAEHSAWELDPDNFAMSNPKWSGFLEKVLSQFSHRLGVSDATIEPHKLMLYGDGSFTRPRNDLEDPAGKIATLCICLPSVHQGGDIVLSYGEQQKVIDTSHSTFDVNVLAWHSDVTHEVKSVSSGHRLVVVYNIISQQPDAATVTASFYAQQREHLRTQLARWPTEHPESKQLVYPLASRYRRDYEAYDFRKSHLKGHDRAVYEVLRDLCPGLELYMFLGHVIKSDSTSRDEDVRERVEIKSLCPADGEEVIRNIPTQDTLVLGEPYQDREYDSEDEGGNVSIYRYHNKVSSTSLS